MMIVFLSKFSSRFNIFLVPLVEKKTVWCVVFAWYQEVVFFVSAPVNTTPFAVFLWSLKFSV